MEGVAVAKQATANSQTALCDTDVFHKAQPPVRECLYSSNKVRAMTTSGENSDAAAFIFNFGTKWR
jgi:hypothetical protein